MKSLKRDRGSISSGFYFATGAIMLIFLVMSKGSLLHLGFLGALSIAASYGLSKMKRWSLYLLTIILFSGTTFSATTIYSSTRLLESNLTTLSLQTAMALYLVLLVISFLDAFSKREKFG